MSPKRIVIPLVLVAALAAVAAGAWYAFGRPRKAGQDAGGVTASGTVEATEAQLGFQATGQVAEIAVREGDRVRAGQVLARLDAAEAEARRAQAAAQVAAARAAAAELEHGFRREEIAQARAGFAAARDRLANAESDYRRTRVLYDGGAVSREALDNARLARDVARSQSTQAAEQLRLLEAGPSREKIAQARAQLAQAEAALRAAEVVLGHVVITAPFEGLVTVRHREPGEIVPAGSPVLTLINPADRWVRIYVKEDRVGAVRLGSRAAITSDTYPGKTYPGEVAFIASQAEFTPKNVQTAEERVKLVYAVKVRIVGDPGYELKPGLPADVRLAEGAAARSALPSEASPPGPLSLTGEGEPEGCDAVVGCSAHAFEAVHDAHSAAYDLCRSGIVSPLPSGRGGQGVRPRRVERSALDGQPMDSFSLLSLGERRPGEVRARVAEEAQG